MAPTKVTLDGQEYVCPGRIQLSILSAVGQFPEASPPDGVPKLENFLPHKQLEQSPPWSVGLQTLYRDGYIWDEENINALFPGLLTLGPLKNAATFSGPTTFKANNYGFAEAVINSTRRLIMYGNGGTADDEPLWYFAEATGTWTDLTLNADFVGDVRDITGVVQIGNTIFAINKTPTDNASATDTYTFGTTETSSSPAWSAVKPTAGGDEDIGGATVEAHFLIAFQATIRTLAYDSTLMTIVEKSNTLTTSAAPDTLASNTWTTVGTINQVRAAPRGYVKWLDGAGAEAPFIGTSTGLYKGGSTPVLLWSFRTPSSSYTGRLWIGADDNLHFIDGENEGYLTWNENANPEIHYLGPKGVDDPDVLWDGVPLAKSGNLTAGCPSNLQPWGYFAAGGLAASRNTWIGIRSARHHEIPRHTGAFLINCPYKNATAQRAITAMIEYTHADGVTRLHILEEQAAGGDQDPQYFDYITDNPEQQTSYKFAASGVVTLSRNNFFLPSVLKGVYGMHFLGDDFDATEKITVKFATNGGALGSGHDVVSTPDFVWADEAAGTTVGVSATDEYAELTLARDTTNTLSPKLHALSWAYDPIALKRDSTPIRVFDLEISRDPAEYRRLNLRTENVLSTLLTSYAKRTLLALSYDEGDNNQVSASVKMEPFVVNQLPQQAAERGAAQGTGSQPIRIRLVERI